jgi:hypothetical protein
MPTVDNNNIDRQTNNGMNNLSRKGRALLDWVLCESGAENVTFNMKECARLYNVYKDVCKEEAKLSATQHGIK